MLNFKKVHVQQESLTHLRSKYWFQFSQKQSVAELYLMENIMLVPQESNCLKSSIIPRQIYLHLQILRGSSPFFGTKLGVARARPGQVFRASILIGNI